MCRAVDSNTCIDYLNIFLINEKNPVILSILSILTMTLLLKNDFFINRAQKMLWNAHGFTRFTCRYTNTKIMRAVKTTSADNAE